jgi:hypothetical protein
MNKLPELLDQFKDTRRVIELSEHQLATILDALDAEGYEPVGGASPAFTTLDTFVANQSTNFVGSELAKKNFPEHVVGPYALFDEEGVTRYYPRGRMVYVKPPYAA